MQRHDLLDIRLDAADLRQLRRRIGHIGKVVGADDLRTASSGECNLGDAVAGRPDRALGMTDAELYQVIVGSRAGDLAKGSRERAE